MAEESNDRASTQEKDAVHAALVEKIQGAIDKVNFSDVKCSSTQKEYLKAGARRVVIAVMEVMK